MRFTSKLNAQHLGWMFKKHWQVQGKCTPRSTGAETELEKLAIQISNPQNIASHEHQFEQFAAHEENYSTQYKKHPIWHDKSCHVVGNNTVLLEGLPQAQILTNTLEIKCLPKKILNVLDRSQIPSSVDKYIQNCIIGAQILTSQQEKLQKVKNPERRSQNLPRVYGSPTEHRNRVLITKLISECERLSGHSLVSQRKIVDNVNFRLTFCREDDQIQLSAKAEKLVIANRPLEEIKGSYNDVLPDLYPLKCTISIPKKHVYSANNICPLNSDISWAHPHTMFSYFDKESVNNSYGTSINSTQIESRTLLNAFCVAAVRAQQQHGASIFGKKLEKPIVLQTVQTDGRIFHFGVLQLNTLALTNSEPTKNYWFHQPNVELYSRCTFKDGSPIIEGYNRDVFRHLYALYNTV